MGLYECSTLRLWARLHAGTALWARCAIWSQNRVKSSFKAAKPPPKYSKVCISDCNFWLNCHRLLEVSWAQAKLAISPGGDVYGEDRRMRSSKVTALSPEQGKWSAPTKAQFLYLLPVQPQEMRAQCKVVDRKANDECATVSICSGLCP